MRNASSNGGKCSSRSCIVVTKKGFVPTFALGVQQSSLPSLVAVVAVPLGANALARGFLSCDCVDDDAEDDDAIE